MIWCVRSWYYELDMCLCNVQLVQIAKILNTHVDSLQWIDHNTGLCIFCTVFRKKHTLKFSFIFPWNMFRFPHDFQGMLRRKLVFHQCKSWIFFSFSDVMLTSYFHVCKLWILLLKTYISKCVWVSKSYGAASLCKMFLNNGHRIEYRWNETLK